MRNNRRRGEGRRGGREREDGGEGQGALTGARGRGPLWDNVGWGSPL